MEYKRVEISPGATLGVIDTDKFKINDLWLSFTAPLSRDTAALNSLLPLVLARGTRTLPGIGDISRKLDDLYAAVLTPRGLKRGETHLFGFFASMLDDFYSLDGSSISGGVLSLLRELLTDPSKLGEWFRPEYVEGEKKVLCSYISAEINNKKRYAYKRCVEEMCADEPYGIADSGTIEEVMSVTPKTLWEHYRRVLSECHIEAFYVGRYSDAIFEKLCEITDGIGSAVKPDHTPIIIRRAERVRRVTEAQPVRQGKLCVGYRTGAVLSDPDYHKYTVFNSVFGASPVSKLFMNIREKLSLAYYCSSYTCDPLKGIMMVSSGIDAANRENTEEEIARQLAAIAAGDITDTELDAAKKSIVNSYRESYDVPSSLESWYTLRMMAGRSDSPAENAKRILSVTKEDVAEIASRVTTDTVYFMEPTLLGEEEDADE